MAYFTGQSSRSLCFNPSQGDESWLKDRLRKSKTMEYPILPKREIVRSIFNCIFNSIINMLDTWSICLKLIFHKRERGQEKKQWVINWHPFALTLARPGPSPLLLKAGLIQALRGKYGWSDALRQILEEFEKDLFEINNVLVK